MAHAGVRLQIAGDTPTLEAAIGELRRAADDLSRAGVREAKLADVIVDEGRWLTLLFSGEES